MEFLPVDDLKNETIFLRLTGTCDARPEKDLVPAYYFDICLPDGTRAGKCDLRIGHSDRLAIGGNIGYTVFEPYRGHHYAAMACRLLFRQARKHGMEYVLITCDPSNRASAGTCRLAGGTDPETAEVPESHDMYARGYRQVLVYRFDLAGAGQNPGDEKTEITYRKLTENDLGTFIRMRITQLREEGATEELDLVPALEDYYRRHLADGTFVSWLALDGEKIVGTSGMSFVEKPPYFGCPSGRIGLLSSMYTDPAYRRRGIAKELLRRVTEEARAYGCGAVQITASDMGVLLYTDFGFVKNGNFMQYTFGPSL